MTQPKLQVKNCDLFYGDFQALKNINLSIAEKELIPLILLTQRMCPPDTVSIMNCTGKRDCRSVPIQ